MGAVDTRKVVAFFMFVFMPFVISNAAVAFEDPRGEGTPMMGLPISAFANIGKDEGDMCPEGRAVITDFLAAWEEEDYKKMFSLLDSPDESGYTFEEARMDFRFMEYKSYVISSVRRIGDDFEFFLSYGEWRDGDKDMKKVMINGKNFRIILQKNRSIFKASLAG